MRRPTPCMSNDSSFRIDHHLFLLLNISQVSTYGRFAMNDSNYEKSLELGREAYQLPPGDLKVQLFKEAVRLADADGDLNFAFLLRLHLVEAAIQTGHNELAIPTFAWCRSHFEMDPNRFQEHLKTFLFVFKNLLHDSDEFPQLSREQVDELRAEMAGFYRQFGFNMRPVHYIQLTFATRIGDLDQAIQSHQNYLAIPRDELADCAACEADTEIEYFDLLGEWENAIEAARPNLLGHQSCGEVPHRTFSIVLRPLAMLKRYDEADDYQRRGYRLICDNTAFLNHVALQIAYLVHRERDEEALRMFERHLSWAVNTHHLRARYQFYIASKRVLTQLAANRATCKLNLPEELPAYSSDGDYEPAKLIEWLDQQLRELGTKFNERNGNQFFTQELVQRFEY